MQPFQPYYLDQEDLQAIKKDFITFDELEKQMETQEVRYSFAHNKTEPIKLDCPDTILVNPLKWLLSDDGNHVDGYCDTVDDKKELVELIESLEFYETESGNSYNQDNYLSRDVSFHKFESDNTDQVLVEYSVHIGLDVRAGYTKSVWFLYEDDYTFLTHLTSQFRVASAMTTDDKFEINVYVQPFAGGVSIETFNTETRHESYIDGQYLDYDIDDIGQDLVDELNESQDVEYNVDDLIIERID